MKDRQIQAPGAQPSVPILSPFLHWLAMPAIVCLRSGFGYSFLSPKSVFLTFAWASLLFLIDSWLEKQTLGVPFFAAGTSLIYVLHLLTAFTMETRRKGKHDFYSGTSHLLRLPGFSQQRSNEQVVTFVHLWLEPVIVVMSAAILKAFTEQGGLSKWLLLVAGGLWMKEFLNYWYGLRVEKKHGDIIEDAEEKMPGAGGSSSFPLPKAGGRKPRTRRAPQTAEEAAGSAEQEKRFAEILRLMPPYPPYDLNQAERHYRDLIKVFHPDPNSGNLEEGKAAQLNAAIEFFRQRSA
jgi:hypothetical protein